MVSTRPQGKSLLYDEKVTAADALLSAIGFDHVKIESVLTARKLRCRNLNDGRVLNHCHPLDAGRLVCLS